MGMRKHDAIPEHGTITRETDHQPVDGTSEEDFPLLARCQSCKRVLRAENPDSDGWKHVGTLRNAETPVAGRIRA